MTYRSDSTHETKAIAADLAATLKGGELVLLDGLLGAGKTTFVRGMTEALGADTLARSPTFTVMNVYRANHPSVKQLVHLDFYRLTKPEEIHELGLEDWLGRPDTVVVAEWPPESLPVPSGTPIIRVTIEGTGEEPREFTVDAVTIS
ncbi:tRNA (adenosine(37)-N6)-threonylcarbamoyltransferase complex ATPase subunit type 1 TsaE [Candidatus Uhrbacteria bacterium RIFCSPHIGHO2_01_FULL_63_20]|uniref:tRNA threonylcarbamoyladenosine biosynthesis protein TsaE n=1 Tax=Candidatus Uhrbacteria bacterium RIFCSPHIGHO2_01_FULL_63_20 TaxID=1802385 RepID=A0A1F7TMQ6_9BACT|nr:MAG: tRNA (adenosine(37)-N6)-threonylcarbamoyltransferase complex ATPase subunit type 1 TsaE [Candidatus Uhrbacteria bacterium RIFCSPHIGHO2_01_FULL_63_20]